MLIRLTKISVDTHFECQCREGCVARIEGRISRNNLVVFCTCGRRYVCTSSGVLTESEGKKPSLTEVIKPDEAL